MANLLVHHFSPTTLTNPTPSLTFPPTVNFLRCSPTPHPHAITTYQNFPSRTVKCMANPRRVAQVSNQIMRIISEMLQKDVRLQHALLPETALGADRYLSTVVTVTDVEVSGDLQVVKVYVSIFGDERGRQLALAGLQAKTKYIRGLLGSRIRLRRTPEIRFMEDEALERGSRVIAILDKIKKEKELKAARMGKKGESSDLADEEDDWDDDDDDDDVEWSGDDEDDDDVWSDDEPDKDVIYVK